MEEYAKAEETSRKARVSLFVIYPIVQLVITVYISYCNSRRQLNGIYVFGWHANIDDCPIKDLLNAPMLIKLKVLSYKRN